MEYQPKEIYFSEEGRQKLVQGVIKMSKAVKSTLGPSGNPVLIESINHTNSITVTKDGVTVAKSIDLIDPVENLAVRMMKQAADKTATSAGDGTTTAIVLTESLVLNGLEHITPELNRIDVLRYMGEMGSKVVEKLRSEAKRVTSKMIGEVAALSANNDPAIGKIIANAYKSVGRNGIVTIEKSQTSDTYLETTKGFMFDRGYTSHLFINDHKRDECIMDDAFVLVADLEISNVLQLESILKPIVQEGKKLLIIAPCSSNVLNTLAANVLRNNLKVCIVAPPNFGYKQHELMQDIALSVGATYVSEKTGDDLSLINFGYLGLAEKVIVSSDKTVIVKSPARVNQQSIDERVEQLWVAHENATKKSEKEFILERIASLTGGIGVIYVGGQTDLEQKELYDRVDDAVCAVRSALEEGILPGAGRALDQIDLKELVGEIKTKEQWAAFNILSAALKSPITQILENAGLSLTNIYNGGVPDGHGYNLKSGKMGDLIEMGIIDPLKVTRSALQNALSVATTILSTNSVITMARSYEQK